MKVKIKHIDGKTDVTATVFFNNSEINLEYRFNGMTYGRTMDLLEAVKTGLVECPHPNVNPILGFENSQIGELCTICNKEMFFNSSHTPTRHNSHFKTNYTDSDLIGQQFLNRFKLKQ